MERVSGGKRFSVPYETPFYTFYGSAFKEKSAGGEGVGAADGGGLRLCA